MIKSRAFLKFIPAFCLLLSLFMLASCGSKEEAKGGYDIYAVSKDETRVSVVDTVTITGVSENGTGNGTNTEDTEYGVKVIASELKRQPEDVSMSAAISDKVKLTGYKIKADVLRLYFAPSYSELSKGREVLTRAAIVRSFCQLDGISQVEFYVGDMPLIGFNGVVTGAMSADQFIDNAGNEINAYEQTTISLYLTDETGSTLREIHRDCVYNSNISIDKLVVEEIIRGPENGEEKYLYPVISPMTKVISVTTADGTCYVNLDSGFLEKQGNVTPEVAIYSIVNSLVEQPNINKVQISVDGNSDIMFMETIPLTQVFERNLEIMNTQ